MQTPITEAARAYRERLFMYPESPYLETDPEFISRFDNFAFDEVVNAGNLDERTRFLAIVAALMGCHSYDGFRAMAPAALNAGVTPVELKEIVYQASAYLGIGRVLPFLHVTNDILRQRGESLPLEPQGTTTPETRREAGNQAQVDIFGEGMRASWEHASEETRHIDEWLASNCFGDWYTRGGLTLAQRELVTFCFLAAMGGCEPQLKAHAMGNMRLGNDHAMLIDVVSQCVPYIGYPRALNALRCVDEAAEALK